jgi:hypothetical protein
LRYTSGLEIAFDGLRAAHADLDVRLAAKAGAGVDGLAFQKRGAHGIERFQAGVAGGAFFALRQQQVDDGAIEPPGRMVWRWAGVARKRLAGCVKERTQ